MKNRKEEIPREEKYIRSPFFLTNFFPSARCEMDEECWNKYLKIYFSCVYLSFIYSPVLAQAVFYRLSNWVIPTFVKCCLFLKEKTN